MMELYQAAPSPFARKCRVVLLETGQQDDVTLVESAQTPLDPNPANQNPLAKIPSLTRPDGPAIYDSRVICRFLNDRAGAKLYPKTREWEILTLEATGDGIMDAAVLMVYEGRLRPAEKQFPEFVEAQWSKVARALDALESRWLSHLSGPIDIGQISVACALEYLDFRHGDRNWRQGRDALAQWQSRFGERASMQATQPG